jgi:hypothetical protein
VAAACAVAYLALDPPSADLAAQELRTALVEEHGLGVWNGAWYAGHHTPGYSVLFPPLAALLDPRVVGALAAVGAAAAFTALVGGARVGERRVGGRRLAALWFAAATVTSLISGRLTFALGLALGLAGLLAADRERPAAAGVLAAVTSLASPVAGVFTGLAGGALVLTGAGPRRAAGLALGVGAAIPIGLLVLAFPEGGTHPFVSSSFWPALAATLLVAAVAPPQLRALRAGALLYALVLVAAFAIPSPLGGNAARLAALFAAPLAALALWPRRRVLLAVVALPLLYLQWSAAVRDWSTASDEPSVDAAFHAPLIGFLERQGPARVEIPFTSHHWEAFHVARRFPLARGWERQLDRERNALFYADELDPDAYERWLRENGVRFVALPDTVDFDYAGEDEAALVRRGVPFLREAWRGGAWRVYAVRPAPALADGPVQVTRLDAEGFALRAARPGVSTVRVRFTPYWAVTRGAACVEPAPGDWTRVRVRRAGAIEVATRFALGRVRSRAPRCAER